MADFEEIGFSIDYFVNGKYVGYQVVAKADREIYGYGGRIKSTIEKEIVFRNKKKIKAGTEVITECFPLNGKLLEEFKLNQNNK